MPDIKEILQNLEVIKQDIASAKQDKAKQEGVLSEHLKALKTLGVKSVSDGTKKMKVLKKEIKALEEEIQDQYIKLDESYEW